MAAQFNNVRSKLNRAIAAYLVSVGCGGVDDVLPANVRTFKTYPNTLVRATMSTPDPPLTGVREVTVHISIKGTATEYPNEPNPGTSRVAFDDRVAQTYDALMQSDDGETLRATAEAITESGRALAVAVDDSADAVLCAQNNSDMLDFTCSAWYDMGEGEGDGTSAEGTSWEEVLIFKARCSPSNVD
jgi:hypothetical protein